MNKNAWIQVHSGGKFHPLAVLPGEVRIDDIAHALSNVCRFGGHCREFYSVAQHCVIVSHLLPQATGAALAGLLHDASEAYLGDVVKPLKDSPAMVDYADAEERLQAHIYALFGVDGETHYEDVHHADMTALATEARDLMGRLQDNWASNLPQPMAAHITPMCPDVARCVFLGRFKQLTIGSIPNPAWIAEQTLAKGDD